MPLRTGAERSRPRTLGRNLFLAASAAGLGLALAEGLLAWLAPNANLRTTAGLNIFRPDTELGYTLQPNVVRHFRWLGREIVIHTDAGGHRVPADAGADTADAPVLAFAGDSYVFGNEVQADEAFPWLVGEWSGVGAVNLGVGGYSLDQSARALERYLIHPGSHRVRHAFLGVYIGNDLEWGAAPRPSRVDLNGFLLDPGASATGRLVQLRRWLALNSRVAFLVISAYRAAVHPPPPPPVAAGAPPTAGRWIYDPARLTDSSLAGHRAVLARIASVAAAAGVPLTVVLLPEVGQVDGTLSDLPNRRLVALCEELGIAVADPLPVLRVAGDDVTPLYNAAPFGHLSPRGHQVVAELLAALR